jgi:hypothetical protein
MKVTIILSSDDRIFTACSTYDDLSEYNAFVLMKTEGASHIKRIICVDEYECVFLPDMKFIDYIVNDCEENSNAFIFADPSHIMSVFSIMQINKREQDEKNVVQKNNVKRNSNNIIYGNQVPSADSSNIDFNSEFDDFSEESQKPVVVMSDRKNSNIHTSKEYPSVSSVDDFAESFEGFSFEAQRPVVVMKKQNPEPKVYENNVSYGNNYQQEDKSYEQKSIFSAIKSKHISKIAKKKSDSEGI